MAWPTFRAISSGAYHSDVAGTTSITVNVPSGVVEGDVMIAAIGLQIGGTLTEPSGWIIAPNDDPSVESGTFQIWYKFADADDEAGTTISYTFTHSNSSNTFWHSRTVAYQPPTGKSVWPVAGSYDITVSPSATTATGISVDAIPVDALLCFFSMPIQSDTGPATPPTGMTERWDYQIDPVDEFTGNWFMLWDEELAATGPTGDRVATLTGDGQSENIMIVVGEPLIPAIGWVD